MTNVTHLALLNNAVPFLMFNRAAIAAQLSEQSRKARAPTRPASPECRRRRRTGRARDASPRAGFSKQEAPIIMEAARCP